MSERRQSSLTESLCTLGGFCRLEQTPRVSLACSLTPYNHFTSHFPLEKPVLCLIITSIIPSTCEWVRGGGARVSHSLQSTQRFRLLSFFPYSHTLSRDGEKTSPFCFSISNITYDLNMRSYPISRAEHPAFSAFRRHGPVPVVGGTAQWYHPQ